MAKKEVKKITLGGILSWIFGIIFALAGLGAFTSSSFIAGFTMLIMGAVLLPPMNKLFKEKMNFELSKGIKIAVIIIGFIIFSMTINTDTTAIDNINNQANTQVETSESSIQQNQAEEPKCAPDWQCLEWSICSQSGTQTRTCSDKNNCGILTSKPAVSQSCTPPVIEPEPITLSGSGQEASDIFELIEGIAIFEMENTGSGHFGIWLMDDMGNNVELLVNEIGPFDGSKIAHIGREGEYILDVSAQGSWDITIKQPRPTKAPETKSFSGRYQQYEGPFYLASGLTKFNLENTGSGHFGIWLLDSEGNNVELLVNEIGPFDGSKAVGIRRDGIYYFDISAQGNWEITIE